MMKQFWALLLVLCLLISLAACTANKGDDTETFATDIGNSEVQKNDYQISEDVPEGSVIDGVMTYIDGADAVLTKTVASWLDTCVLYEVNIRQYTEEGTFAAFEEHLDRLQSMGVNTLWLMPIHPISETGRKGTLGSYYAVSDYKGVNPEFGTIEDFQHLVDKAHGMGMRVILDWVANHTGWDNAWITEHDDWYEHDNSGNIRSPYDWTDTAQLDYENYEMRAEMIQSMQYWVEEIGVDGFRCDHAIGVPANFWNAAVYQLKSVNSEIMMLAESSAAQPLTEYAFDSCYNDMLYGQALMTKGGVAVSDIKDGMKVHQNYRGSSFPMNYLDNHDKNSYEGSIVGRFGDTYEPLLALSFLSPGIPLIYTSNEEGYDHEIEFFEKDTVQWDDQPKYAELITALSKLKTGNSALASTNRSITFVEPSNSKLFVFTRSDGENTVIYAANLGKEAIRNVTFDLGVGTARCVLRAAGGEVDTTETDMTEKDFCNRDYEPYEFYVLTV
ncbi:MAG: hypothetical protein IJH07_02355 [Ruminococcus sp.]|nr:hypothetical protein [Ruminococcus sp.]